MLENFRANDLKLRILISMKEKQMADNKTAKERKQTNR